MKFEAKFINTTNKYIGEGQIDKVGEVSIENGFITFFNTEGTMFRSSPIENIKKDKEVVIFETINSTYIFKIIGKHDFDLNLKEDTNIISIIKYFSSLGGRSFNCVTSMDSIEEENLSIVEFDKNLTLKEAQFLINENNILAQNNKKVLRLLLPINEREIILNQLPYDVDGNINVAEIEFVPLKAIMGQDTISIKHFFKKLSKLGIYIQEDETLCS